MRKRSNTRLLNGIVSALVVCFFFAHAILGALASFIPLPRTLEWLVWAGVACIVVHIVLSIATSREQLFDKEQPPSDRKKRHLALKWATGIVLACAVCAHVASVNVYGASTLLASATGALVAAALAVVLAVHVCVGAKSLLVDIGADKRLQTPLRVAAIALTALCCVLALASGLE